MEQVARMVGARESAEPKRIDAKRVKYLKAKCLQKYGIERPLHWLTGQKVSEVPDLETWKILLRKTTAPFADMRWVDLLSGFGFRPSADSLTGWHGVGHLLATMLDPDKAAIFEAETGERPTFYVLPRSCADTLFLLRHDGHFDRIAMGKPTLAHETMGPIIEATILRGWGEDMNRRGARTLICESYIESVQRQNADWESEYDRSTIACTLFENQYQWGPGVLRVSKVVVWEVVQGKIVAELFAGDKFTTDSFDSDIVQHVPMKGHTVDTLLYGTERRFLFRRRSLEFLLREFDREMRTLCVVPLQIDAEVPVENILIARRSSLEHRSPTDGVPLLSPGI